MTVTIDAPNDSRVHAGEHGLTRAEWGQIVGMIASIAALYFTGFGMLVVGSAHHVTLGRTAAFGVGTGILALSLGMRHAFDADHISAIDNTIRKLLS
ncbi:MAG TPA: hypothetical protein VG368_00070, partial [Acidimicrobiales bacterium]|nr:hypothetical protein [Acidimicrobiales bacterium]